MKYKGPGVDNIQRLIYPCPSRSLDSLGTHLVSYCSEGRATGSVRGTQENGGAVERSGDLSGGQSCQRGQLHSFDLFNQWMLLIGRSRTAEWHGAPDSPP